MTSIEPPSRLPPQKPVGEIVWVAGGEVDECSVSLRFFGKDLEPDEVTQALGIIPTAFYRKGDIFRGKKSDIIRKTASWRHSVMNRSSKRKTNHEIFIGYGSSEHSSHCVFCVFSMNANCVRSALISGLSIH